MPQNSGINKKVLLRERKRHTARRVASARYAALSRGEGTLPHPRVGGYPIPGWRGYPSHVLIVGEYPIPGWGVSWPGLDVGGTTHHPDLAGGYPPSSRPGCSTPPPSRPGWGTPPHHPDLARRVVPWVPLSSRSGQGTPPGWGTPPDLGWHTPQTWDGVPPSHYQDLDGLLPPSPQRWGTPPRPEMGYPPPPTIQIWTRYPPPPPRNVKRQTPVKTVPSRHTTYAGDNYCEIMAIWPLERKIEYEHLRFKSSQLSPVRKQSWFAVFY